MAKASYPVLRKNIKTKTKKSGVEFNEMLFPG